jgi:4-carboxymuconolactone decarboxylase
MSRIGYASDADYGERIDLVSAIDAGRGFVPNVFRTMLFSPDLTGGWVGLANAVRMSSSLDVRSRELVILLVAHLHESTYEWQHHAKVARGVGISEAQIDWLAHWPAGDWEPDDQAVLTFAAATATRSDVPQWCLDHLVAKGERFVVDLAVTTSYYVAVAHFTHALAIEPEPANNAERQAST